MLQNSPQALGRASLEGIASLFFTQMSLAKPVETPRSPAMAALPEQGSCPGLCLKGRGFTSAEAAGNKLPLSLRPTTHESNRHMDKQSASEIVFFSQLLAKIPQGPLMNQEAEAKASSQSEYYGRHPSILRRFSRGES